MKKLYQVVKNAITPEVCQLARDSLLITKDLEYANKGIPLQFTTPFGDSQCPNSFASYGHPVCEALLLTVKPIAEKVSGKRLSPTYSYSRIYWKKSILDKHTDRPSCEYSVTLCLDNNPTAWPIYMGGKKVTLNAGDLVVYKGCDVEHWRDPLDVDTQVTQVFLHYVDLDGPYAEWAFDKRPVLGIVKETSNQ
jgi:hypothetical protein